MPHLISEMPCLGWRVLLACGHCPLERDLLSPVTHHPITQPPNPPADLVSLAGLVIFWLGLETKQFFTHQRTKKAQAYF